MPTEAGIIVRSTAGHDARGWFVVVSAENGFVCLADGKTRLLEKPKLKSEKHIRKTNTQLDLSSITTNKKLREALREFRGNEGGNQLV